MSDRASRKRPAGAWVGLLALALGTAACGAGPQAGFVATNPPPRAMSPRPPAEVALLDEAPAYPYVEVGLIEVLGPEGSSAADRDALGEELRRRGAERGCDAVGVLGEIDWVYVVESAGSTSARHGVRGVCIVRR